MNLVKWFRKHNTKVMAVVAVVIMIGFIGGSALSYLLTPKRTLERQVVAYFGDNKKITPYDLALASRELDILRLTGAYDLLKAQGLRGFLLAELLFSEGKASVASINRIRQIIRANQYSISDKQIIDIYRRSMPSHVYWYCLKNEAQLAGLRIQNDYVGKLLAGAIPKLFDGQTYSQRISLLINRYGVPDAQILATFGKLLAVYQYCLLICSTEDVTISQLMHIASWENETINVEFVKFDSAVFATTQEKPSEEEMLQHFNKYKKFFAGDVNEANPYGFGYKLPDRIQMEYIAVKLDDISHIVTPPTPEETEQYYQKHAEQFTESAPQDPNDPNSPAIEHTKSYAEAANIISKQLLQDKINSKAENILQEARKLTEAGLQDIDLEKISVEQLKQKIGDYEATAKTLATKYKIKIYSGQTGLLSAADMQQDEYLRRLYVLSGGLNPVRLAKIVFSIPDSIGDQLQEGKPTSVELTEMQKPKMYENIVPVEDYLGEIMAVVRVTQAEKASEPETINQSFSKRTLKLQQDQEQEDGEIYSIKEKIALDLKKLAAIQQGQLRSKAEEFIDFVALVSAKAEAGAGKDGWQASIDKFNELYGQTSAGSVEPQAKKDKSNPNEFKLENSTNLQRISSETLATLEAQSQGEPDQRLFVRQAQKWLTIDEVKIESRFIEQLYSLLPPDSNTVDSLPLLMEFKPNMSFYVIKDISVKRLDQQEYEKIKARQLLTEDHIQTESLTPVFFNPENILKRMNFRLAKKEPEESKEAQ